MRHAFVVVLLVIGLLALPLALAAGGPERAQEARDHAAERRGAALDAQGLDAREEAAQKGAAAAEHRGAPEWVAAFLDRMHAIRTAWLDGAASVREQCMTNEEREHCIRDGYRELRAQARSDWQQLIEERRALRG